MFCASHRHAEVINQLGETIGFQKYELQRNEEIRVGANSQIYGYMQVHVLYNNIANVSSWVI